ncbi:MglA protein [Candidatus Vecturithrix granuli]|uniref:MglA protein n=1 Tax=Vecturithrix granuli TaxID=1499967 RepID=A0A081C6K5_VECG1|nr:MglA protein [Candidatus Vecturithrix granuli]
MPIFNYKAKEMIVKIVYYGPGLCGKTTSLQFLHQQTIPERKGELYFLATETDETIYFELLPLYVGEIKNFKLRFQVYTVPGQVKYNNTRKAVLQGVDAIVFVADSQITRREANVISFKNLHYNLKAGYNILLKNVPMVYEFNKRDMNDLLTVEELNQDINPWHLPYFETIATQGDGVLEAFEAISAQAIRNLEQRLLQMEGKSSGRRSQKKRGQSPAYFLHDTRQAVVDEVSQDIGRINLPERTDEFFGENVESIFPEEEITSELEPEMPILPEENEETILPAGELNEIDLPIFAEGKEKELSYVDILAVTYHNGEIIFEEGEPGDEMYFIEDGQVKIVGSYKNTRKVVTTYQKGDFFGEMALFGGKTRSARAVAIGTTRLLAVTKETLSTQIPKKPEIALALLEALSNRIRNSTKTIGKLANQNKELTGHLKKARDMMKQLKEQNDFLRRKLEKGER